MESVSADLADDLVRSVRLLISRHKELEDVVRAALLQVEGDPGDVR